MNVTPTMTDGADVRPLSFNRWHYATPVLAIAFALAGWFVPEFYDWTGADQSRPAPVVGWIALAIVICDLLAIAGLIAWQVRNHAKRKPGKTSAAVSSGRSTNTRNQYSLRHLLAFSTIVALLLALGRWISPLATTLLVFVGVVVWAIAVGYRNRDARLWIVWIAWLQFAPFLWVGRGAMESILGMRSSEAVLSLLPMVLSLPSLFPYAYLGLLFPLDIRSTQWIFILFTALGFAVGVWLSCQGPKRTLAWGLIIGTCSLFGSFILNALMRA